MRWILPHCHEKIIFEQLSPEPYSINDNISELLTVSKAERFSFETGVECIAETEDELMTVAIEKGSVTVRSPFLEGEVQTGQAFMISPSASGCTLVPLSDGSCTAIALKGVLAKKIMGMHFMEGKVFAASGLPDVLEASKALEHAETPEIVSEKAYSLLMRLHYSCKAYGVKEGYPQAVTAALGLIHDEFAYLDGVDEIAEKIGISSNHLIRLFSKNVGVSPGRYLKLRRLECAKELLSQSEMPVSAVSELSGFSDPNYFSKVFRKENGISPSEYAAAHKGENKISSDMRQLIDESYL